MGIVIQAIALWAKMLSIPTHGGGGAGPQSILAYMLGRWTECSFQGFFLLDVVQTGPLGTAPPNTSCIAFVYVSHYTYVDCKQLLAPRTSEKQMWEMHISFTQKSIFILSSRHLRLWLLSTNYAAFSVYLWQVSEWLELSAGPEGSGGKGRAWQGARAQRLR